MHYLEVLDRLEERLEPEYYLEIGSRDGMSLSRRSSALIAVDPEFAIAHDVFNKSPSMMFFQQTSDAFFEADWLGRLGIRPGLAFVDGMHLFEFALRDVMNCERRMAPDGVICLHDVAPYNRGMADRDPGSRLTSGAPWTGDVWKVMAILKEYRPDLKVELLSASKTGLGVVSGLDPASDVLKERYNEIIARYTDLTIEAFGVDSYFSTLGHKSPDSLSIFANGA